MSYGVSLLGLLMVAVVLAVGIGVVVLLFKKLGKVGWWAAGVAGVVLALVLLRWWFLPAVRYASVVEPGGRANPAAVTFAGGVHRLNEAEDTANWRVGEELPFEPDVYPTVHSAATALATKAGAWVQAHGSNERPIGTIIVAGKADEGVRERVAQVLREQRSAEVRLSGSAPAGKAADEGAGAGAVDGTAVVEVGTTAVGSVSVSGESGYTTGDNTCRLTVRCGGATVSYSANYSNKPWVDRFAEFVSRNPEKQWVLAQSTSVATSAFEAQQSALADAVEKMRLQVLKWQPSLKRSQVVLDASVLDEAGLVADRFVQSYRRPYGRLWREVLLLDAAPEKLRTASLRRQIAIVRATRGRLLHQVLSLAGMMGLICVVYLFLNAATKGYYTWSLRIAAVVLAAVGVFLVVRLL